MLAAPRQGSLRRRLLAGFLAVLAAVLIVSALFQYFALRSFLIRAAASRLQTEARAAGPQGAAALVRALADPQTAVWVLTADHTIAAASAETVDMPVDPRTVRPPWTVTGDTLVVRVPVGGGSLARRPPPGPGPGLGPGPGPIAGGTIVLATSLADVTGVLDSEVRLLGFGSLAALVAAAFAAAWTLARSLRPLQAIAATADAVSAGSLDRRAAKSGLPAELAAVATALNGMLDRLAAALREERAAKARMRQFLADASHELRTPLTAVLGYLELWRQGAGRGEAELEQGLENAHNQARRMAGLVDGLLALARVEEAGAQVAPFDLSTVLTELSGEELGESVRWPEAGPAVRIRGNRDAVARAVRNLVGNALKFGPPDGPVDVSLQAAGGWAVLEVADRGPGIDPSDLPRVFERFYRGKSRRPGSGLGLAIVAAVAQAHGGSAEIAPRPGGGSIARLRLPLAP